MKSKFMRILALILVMSSLISMFTIFAGAEATGSEGATDGTVDESFKLLYHRTFDEGWDIKNGMSIQQNDPNNATTFEIDYETGLDGAYNYFWRLELNTKNNDYAQLNINANQNVGTVVEFDIKSDDICSFANLIHFASKRVGDVRTNYDFMKIVENEVYLMGSTIPAFTLTNNWTTVRMIFDYTYEKYEITDSSTEEDIIENNKYFLMYVYYGPTEDPAAMQLLGGEPIEMYGEAGKGIQYFRFQSTGSDQEEFFGTSVCFDNLKVYDGVNYVVPLTTDMGYGSGINKDYPITEDIIGGSGHMTSKDDLYGALTMKVGVDYCYTNKQRTAIAVAEDGTVFGAPVKMNGEVMISLNKVLNYAGYPSYVHPDGKYVDIAIDFGATYLVVGKNTATVGGQTVNLNAAPGYITDENGNSYLAIALSDVEKIFPGYYGDYDEMGYLTVSAYDNLLYRDDPTASEMEKSNQLSAMLLIMKEFVFDYYTAEEIYEDVKNYTNFEHPYILANGQQIDMMYEEYQALNAKAENDQLVIGSEEYWMWVHYQRIVNDGDWWYTYYAKPDANGNYDTFVGIAPDEYNANGTNKRGGNSLDQSYLDSAGYDPDGGRSEISNRTQRLETITYAYVLTRDVKYLQLCYEIALILGDWTHWGPGHFLNCADASNDFAIFFDWTYNGYVELAAQGVKRIDSNGNEAGEYDVKVLAEILARQGVHEGYLSTTGVCEHISPPIGAGGASYSERTNNWAAVCVGGMTVAALSILGDIDEQYVYEATYMLSENLKSLLAMGMDIYAPDGSYIEGPGYWNYGTNNFFRMCAALDSATGGNYGLMDCWGIDTTCYYACHTEDNDSQYFPFHDGHVGSQDTSYFFYVANFFNDATLYDVRLTQINGNVKNATIIDMIYYPRDGVTGGEEVTLDYFSDNIDLFATRSSWESGALYASMIGGANKVSHGQIDAGDFVYHNGGNIWIYDLGTENYNCPGFWPDATRYRYYVMKPEGNNTIAISTDPAGVPYGQKLEAVANATEWGSNEHGSYVTYDMGNALGAQVLNWNRGMLLTNDRNTTIIQDEIVFKSFQTVYWFAHYSLNYVDSVQLSIDGRTAYMRQYVGTDEHGVKQYQTLRLSIVSNNKSYKFEIMDCYTFIHTTGSEATYTVDKVAQLGTVAERSRNDYRKLAICSGEALTFDVAVAIELIDTETKGTKSEIAVGYEYTSMDNWEPVADPRGLDIDTGDSVVRRGTPNVNTHLVQSISRIKDFEAKGTLFTTRVDQYYRAITDAHYAERMFGEDMPAGFKSEIDALDYYRTAFNEYRAYIAKLQKTQLNFAYKLMGLN